MHEAQLHDANSFLTLTYDDEHLPDDHSLNVRHWQLFAKRLRKRLGPFRFIHCGEYGEEKLRPHYHACLFGQDFRQDRVPFGTSNGHPVYVSPVLAELWPYGFHYIGSVTFDSAAYVASYTMKKRTGDQAERHYQRLDTTTGEIWSVKPEYATMSRRPGLGHGWQQRFQRDLYPHDYAIAKAQKFRPPRYYDRQLEAAEPELYRKLQQRRRQHVRTSNDKHTPERRRAREHIINARRELYQGALR